MHPTEPSAAVVVLGCRVGPDGRPGAALARRAATAAAAFHEGVAPLVVASGGRRWGGVAEARAIAGELVRLGVPARAIVEELWSLSTLENAIGSAAIVRRASGQASPRVVVVTCAWHAARAVADFRAVGLDPLARPAPDPPAGPLVRAWRRAREDVCVRLDRASLQRGRWLREAARWTCEVGEDGER